VGSAVCKVEKSRAVNSRRGKLQSRRRRGNDEGEGVSYFVEWRGDWARASLKVECGSVDGRKRKGFDVKLTTRGTSVAGSLDRFLFLSVSLRPILSFSFLYLKGRTFLKSSLYSDFDVGKRARLTRLFNFTRVT
jgi:hypothetical protein